ncbi:hypothetical protein [Pontiella agarivorans]|uniref:PEP-CTERM sorting domain-containing protein n=1 Tax=Pontiella agarivorans TaxID=3038953 RepID=A0ABU5MW84_9BACT|nr:hypothetical protein [Pontiella agarivorans]MDZ8118479.1 hypothetical protein [Pontiella agarivorans]
MKKLMIVAAACALTAGSFAETAGFQLSLTPDIALQDRDTEIKGVSIGVWNENPGAQWQIGFVNGSTGDSKGFAWLPYLTFYNYAENFSGVHWAWVNNTSGKFVGWQSGIVNIAQEEFVGLQSAWVNYTAKMHGVQLGLVNYAKTVDEWAFQLGLVNIIEDNPWFSNLPGELAQGMIIANWSFGD